MSPLTGRKVLVIGLAAFFVVLAPNLVLAWFAVTTFSGLVVPNSYIASQTFDARRIAQEELGWSVALAHETGTLRIEITGTAGGRCAPPPWP